MIVSKIKPDPRHIAATPPALNKGMVIAVEDYEIGYVPVSQAACTTVKDMLGKLMGRSLPADPDRVHRMFPTRRFRPDQLTAIEDFFRFTVVRDPVDRLLSVYSDRVMKREELRASPRLRGSGLPPRPDIDVFFQNLDGYKNHASVIKHHVMKQSVFIGMNLGYFDRIYTTDDLATLRNDLWAMTGRKLTTRHLNAAPHGIIFDDLAPETQAALRAQTQDDYRLLSAWFTPPWVTARSAQSSLDAG